VNQLKNMHFLHCQIDFQLISLSVFLLNFVKMIFDKAGPQHMLRDAHISTNLLHGHVNIGSDFTVLPHLNIKCSNKFSRKSGI
jgi:hypothetical protein